MYPNDTKSALIARAVLNAIGCNLQRGLEGVGKIGGRAPDLKQSGEGATQPISNGR